MNFLHIMTRVINYEHNVITRLAIVAYHLINSLKGNLRLYLLGRCQEQMMLTCVQCSSDIFDKHFCHFSLHQHPAAAIMNNNNTFAVWDASSVTRYYVDLFFWAVSVIENLSSSIKIAKLGTKVGQLLNKNHTKISQKIVISLPNLVTLDARIWKRNILCHLFLDFFRVFFLSFFLSLSLSLFRPSDVDLSDRMTNRKEEPFWSFPIPIDRIWFSDSLTDDSLSASLSTHSHSIPLTLSLSLFLTLFICLYFSISLYLFLSVCVYCSLSISAYGYIFFTVSIILSISLFVHRPLSLYMFGSLSLFFQIFVSLSVSLFVSVCPYLSFSLSLYDSLSCLVCFSLGLDVTQTVPILTRLTDLVTPLDHSLIVSAYLQGISWDSKIRLGLARYELATSWLVANELPPHR